MSMSIDDVNLSTMFGTSKPRPSNAPKAAIPAIVEEENEADDAGLFSKDRSETDSVYTKGTNVLNQQQENSYNNLFKDDFSVEDSFDQRAKPSPAMPKKGGLFDDGEEDQDPDESLMFGNKPAQ